MRRSVQGVVVRPTRIRRTVAAVLAAALLGSACSAATRRVEGKGGAPASDEVALLEQANAEEHRIRETGTVFEDPLFQPYLDEVTARLCVPFGVDPSIVRVVVLHDARINASVLPNGAVFVYSGLLARLENEAQLAGVLAHVLERFAGRHALKQHRSATTAWWFGLLGGIVSPGLLGNPIRAVEPQRKAGQAADQLLEADRAALLAMVSAGYDGEQMIAAMQTLQPRSSLGSPSDASYPAPALRIARMREQLAAMQADGLLRSDARVGRKNTKQPSPRCCCW